MKYPDFKRNKVFTLPKELRAEIDKLILEKDMGAIQLVNYLKANYSGIELPGQTTLQTYRMWRKDNPTEELVSPVTAPPQSCTQVNTTLDDTDEDKSLLERLHAINQPVEKPKFDSQYDFNLNSNKDVLDTLRVRVTNRIAKLEAAQEDDFDKYTEGVLQKYYSELSNLVKSDIKLASELKDSDKVSIADVKVSIGKIFAVIRNVIEKLSPSLKEQFIIEFKKGLTAYRDDLIGYNDGKDIKR